MCIHIHRRQKLCKKITNKFKTTLPHIHKKKIPRDTHTEDGLRNRSKRVRTPGAQLYSLLVKYLWERYEPFILPAMG